jgi:hypothetical protein
MKLHLPTIMWTLIGGATSAAAATVNMSIGHNTDYNELVGGSPVQAVRTTFTDLLGNLIFGIMSGILFVGLWIRTSLAFAVFILDLVEAAFLWQYMPAEVQVFIYILNFIAVGGVFFKLVSPVYGE